MKSLRLVALCAAALAASSIASASTIITPSRGPTGSPPYTSNITIGVEDGGVTSCNGSASPSDSQCDFTVGTGDMVTGISITLPDSGNNVVCGVSNAFVDGGAFNSLLNGFAPTTTGTGANETATCSYSVFTGTNDDDGPESISQQERDCTASNKNPSYNDFDDCAGVPYDPTANGSQSGDVVFTLTGLPANSNFDADVTSTIAPTPEPGSLALLLLGLGSVALLGYRRRETA